MSVETEVATVAAELVKVAAELLEANMAGDAERERQAILRGNRLTSDELARREASE